MKSSRTSAVRARQGQGKTLGLPPPPENASRGKAARREIKEETIRQEGGKSREEGFKS